MSAAAKASQSSSETPTEKMTKMLAALSFGKALFEARAKYIEMMCGPLDYVVGKDPLVYTTEICEYLDGHWEISRCLDSPLLVQRLLILDSFRVLYLEIIPIAMTFLKSKAAAAMPARQQVQFLFRNFNRYEGIDEAKKPQISFIPRFVVAVGAAHLLTHSLQQMIELTQETEEEKRINDAAFVDAFEDSGNYVYTGTDQPRCLTGWD